MSKKLEIDWLRLSSGSTRHACLPAELLGYVPEESFRGLAVIPKRRLTLCGRIAEPNMNTYRKPVAPYNTIDPARFSKCTHCLNVLAEATWTSTPSVLKIINDFWEKIGKRKANERHQAKRKEKVNRSRLQSQTRIFYPEAKVREDGYLGQRTVAG